MPKSSLAAARAAARPVRHLIEVAAALLLLVASPGAGPVDRPSLPNLAGLELPRGARLIYDTTGSVRLAGISLPVPLHGVTRTEWHFADNHFDSSLVNELAEFNQTSTGRLRAEAGLAPERYTEKRHHRAAVWASFDWSTRRLRFSQSSAEIDAPDGIQDRLSIQFQMAVLHHAFPDRFVPGAHFSVLVAGTHDYSEWLVSVCCEEAVATANGPLRTVRIHSSRPLEGTTEALDMWLAPDLRWFPARVRLVDHDGNVVDSTLRSSTIE